MHVRDSERAVALLAPGSWLKAVHLVPSQVGIEPGMEIRMDAGQLAQELADRFHDHAQACQAAHGRADRRGIQTLFARINSEGLDKLLCETAKKDSVKIGKSLREINAATV